MYSLILAAVADTSVCHRGVIVVADDDVQHSVACWPLIFMVVLLVDPSWPNVKEASLLSSSVNNKECSC